MSSAATARTPFMKIVSNLNEADKNRIICVCLHSKLTETDMKAAAEAFGSASTNSMATMYSTAIKKARVAKSNLASNGEMPKSNGKPDSTPPKPRGSGPKKANEAASGGKKRKAVEDIDDEERTLPTPVSLKKPKLEIKKEIKKEEIGDLPESLLASEKPAI